MILLKNNNTTQKFHKMYLISANESIVILLYRYVFYAGITQKLNYTIICYNL